MSIIYDALKKVENSAVLPAQEPDKKRIPGCSKYFISALILALGIFTAYFFFNFLDNKKTASPLSSAGKGKAAPSRPQPSASIKPLPKPETAPDFILNGVFFSDNEGYALINNQIVRQGDIIGNAAVSKISEDAVELKAGTSTIKLSTSNQ